jgi:hypothetical protein
MAKPMEGHSRCSRTNKDEDWPIWEIDFEGWSIRKGFKRFLKRTEPKIIPQVDRSYTTVTRLQHRTTPTVASESTYAASRATTMNEDRCEEYEDKNEELWAELLEAMTATPLN